MILLLAFQLQLQMSCKGCEFTWSRFHEIRFQCIKRILNDAFHPIYFSRSHSLWLSTWQDFYFSYSYELSRTMQQNLADAKRASHGRKLRQSLLRSWRVTTVTASTSSTSRSDSFIHSPSLKRCHQKDMVTWSWNVMDEFRSSLEAALLGRRTEVTEVHEETAQTDHARLKGKSWQSPKPF